MDQSLFEKIRKLKTNLNITRTLRLIWGMSKGWTLLVILMIFLETIFMIGSLYSLKLIVDVVSASDMTDPEARGMVVKYLVFGAGIGATYNVIKTFSSYVGEIQAARVSEKIDDKIHDIAASLDLSYYESPTYFDILKRAKDAGSYRPNQVILSLLDIVKNMLSLLGAGAVLITINWILLPTLVLFVIPTLLVRVYFSNKQNALRFKHTPAERKSAYLSTLLTSDNAAKEIRSYNLGNFFKAQYYAIRISLLEERLKVSLSRTIGESITFALSMIGFFVCIGYILLSPSNGSLGSFTLFLVIFPQTFNLLQNIATAISSLYLNNIFVSSIYELFDLKPPADLKDEKTIAKQKALTLELKNVSFSYPGSERETLSDISLELPAGKIIALVGTNGAGKTTLIKILAGLYLPDKGEITLGGVDIRSFSIASYRKQIGIVFQDFNKYNFTAGDNIRFGDIERENYNDEDLRDAAVKSGANLYIDTFKDGYDTVMGKVFDNGHEISIGQWQKLATARALYSSSRFLILDEATSALDVLAEKKLFDSFRDNIGDRAALIISHRHSAIKHADYIYVLSNGKITQEGTDEELLRVEGDYSRLFKKKD